MARLAVDVAGDINSPYRTFSPRCLVDYSCSSSLPPRDVQRHACSESFTPCQTRIVYLFCLYVILFDPFISFCFIVVYLSQINLAVPPRHGVWTHADHCSHFKHLTGWSPYRMVTLQDGHLTGWSVDWICS